MLTFDVMVASKHRENRTLAILGEAARGRYGVLAAIAYNVEQLTALVRAAEATRSPLILQLFPSTLKQLPSLVWAASAASKGATVPISVHVDHAQDEEQIRHIVATLPVDSIMVDMSHYEHEENLRKTRELTELCQKHGIAVEAESGRINGGEDGIADTGDLEALFTTPEEVDDFLKVGVQMLAPSVGNIHGDYPPSGPQLQFDRLRKVGEQVHGKAHLVLHGTNDFAPDLVKECVEAGVTKLNVNKLILQPWSEHLKSHAGDSIVNLIDDGIEVLQAETERWMHICGSAGQA
jgi:fructose-bisphosphate aldolase, class II